VTDDSIVRGDRRTVGKLNRRRATTPRPSAAAAAATTSAEPDMGLARPDGRTRDRTFALPRTFGPHTSAPMELTIANICHLDTGRVQSYRVNVYDNNKK